VTPAAAAAGIDHVAKTDHHSITPPPFEDFYLNFFSSIPRLTVLHFSVHSIQHA
jgi:hypothetical protein